MEEIWFGIVGTNFKKFKTYAEAHGWVSKQMVDNHSHRGDQGFICRATHLLERAHPPLKTTQLAETTDKVSGESWRDRQRKETYGSDDLINMS